MRAIGALAVLGLASCGSPPDQQRQFDLAMNSGTYTDVCASARKAADEALQRGDQQSFERWRLSRDIYCATASRDPQGMPSRQDAQEAAERQAFEITQNIRNATDQAANEAAAAARAANR